MMEKREEQIEYLLDRTFPKRLTGKNVGLRRVGWMEFAGSLKEQPDAQLQTLYDSAKKFEQENPGRVKPDGTYGD